MTKKAKIVWTAVAAIFAVACLLGTVLGQPDYEYCQYEHTRDEHCTAHHVTPFIALEIVGFLRDFSEAVTALSGIAVAVFTFTLWRATERLWKAGEHQAKHAQRGLRVQIASTKESLSIARASADAATKAANAAVLNAQAAIRVELPSVSVTKIEINDEALNAGHHWPDKLRASISVKNYGRSPAFLDRISIDLQYASETLPVNPIYTVTPVNTIFYHTKIIERGDEVTYSDFKYFNSGRLGNAPFPIAHVNTSFYLFGQVKFIDFLGDDHTTGFIFLWSGEHKIFIPLFNPPAYCYQH